MIRFSPIYKCQVQRCVDDEYHRRNHKHTEARHIVLPNTLPGPGTVVVEPDHTDLTVWAVVQKVPLEVDLTDLTLVIGPVLRIGQTRDPRIYDRGQEVAPQLDPHYDNRGPLSGI